jgi:hypothetical protein
MANDPTAVGTETEAGLRPVRSCDNPSAEELNGGGGEEGFR